VVASEGIDANAPSRPDARARRTGGDPDGLRRRRRRAVRAGGADYNNGVLEDGSPDPRVVTRLSTMPARTTCRPVACVAGKIGEPCNGADDDAACDSSAGAGDGCCDPCPITAGVTTENEMFVLTGRFIEP
jgi:hypothetical protein